MYSSSSTLKSHNVRLFHRMMAIALFAGTLCTSMASAALAQYNPPADIGLPSRREPGGTRGSCLGSSGAPVEGLQLTPLMPVDQQSNAYFGQTVSPYPTFYWHVPVIASPDPEIPNRTPPAAEFVLMDEMGNEIYTTKFQLEPTTQSGLIRLSLPENAGLAPLEVNKNYKWYFSLICDEFDRGTDIFTEGWVRRVPIDPALSLTTANSYAEAGIWFEALDILAEAQYLGETRPTGEPSITWDSLLEDVGLGNFANVAFLQ
ncbi:MAG: DUF928 domain-containing protein [Cyanothece sp. SIO2G6]|nr:DUF928 domain-containing protein [Cyanothece sp. SIO2G6]